jgi:acyl-CoA reductase-like NAD-dependent aldehyde dehydrogenase
MMSTVYDVRHAQQFIGGEWVDARAGKTFEVYDPFIGEPVAVVPASTEEDARLAIECAHAAFGAWSAVPPAERQMIMLRAAEIVETRRDELMGQLTRETGCTYGFAAFQTQFVPSLLRQCAALSYAPIGQVIPSDTGAFSMAVRRPVGVVGAIAPWNAALILSARAIAAPLALGNTVVLKPSELSPVVGGLLWGEIFAEAGLPEGALNVVTHAPGAAADIGAELVSNPHVRRLNFTGSTATGRKLAEACGRHLKRILLELGGQNPLVVLADADLEYAVNAAAFGAFLHQGQICMSTRRILVDHAISDDFVRRLVEKVGAMKVGDPKEPDTIIGPVINKQALETIKRRVDAAVAAGATILVGGEARGTCYTPTLLTGVADETDLATHETFGPVAIVEVVHGTDAAVERANATHYGLTCGILTEDVDKGLAVAQRMNTGIIHVNDQTVGDEPQMPFGGVKDSGVGRFGGTEVVHEFTDVHWITVQRGSHPFPF